MTKGLATVSTSQLIATVAGRFDELPKKVTKELVADFLNTIENEIMQGAKVRLDKIGIFQIKDRAARRGRNPQTGAEIQIPASKKIGFRVAKSLKEQVGATKATKSQKSAPAKSVSAKSAPAKKATAKKT